MNQLKRDRAKLDRKRKAGQSKTGGNYKHFSQDSWNESNSKTVAAVLRHLQDTGLYAHENADRYGPDIVVYSGFLALHYIEVEQKRVWGAGLPFPWASVQLPERKGKFLDLGLGVEFWILRSDYLAALVIPESSVQKGRLVEVPNREIASGEFFFRIPVGECNYVVF